MDDYDCEDIADAPLDTCIRVCRILLGKEAHTYVMIQQSQHTHWYTSDTTNNRQPTPN